MSAISVEKTSGGWKAAVIYDSRYGNTEKIAMSLETGLKKANIETKSANIKNTDVASLKQYDLLCIGAPTEMFTTSKSMKEFLNTLSKVDLSGKLGFAFDTKFSSSLSGSAAKFIENKLRDYTISILVPRASAIVDKLRGAPGDVMLKDGEQQRFEEIGKQIAAALAARGKTISV